MITLYKYINCFSLTVLICINGTYAQSPVHLSSITQNLLSPVRVAIDNADTIYVTDASQKVILKYDVSGNFLGTITPCGSPLSIAISENNRIFIGDGETGYILKLNPDGTTTVIYTGTLFPSSMVFVSDSLYVVDSKLLHVVVLDMSGNVVRRIGNGTFTHPAGIAYNPKNNRILVSEHGGIGTGFNPVVKVWMFDLLGNLTGSFGSHGNTNGKFYRIQGLDVDRCGNIYVPDPFQGNVSVFDESGVFITKFGIWGDTLGQLNVPLDIAINSKDSIWITSMNNGSLEIYKINFALPTSNITTGNKTICSGDTVNIPIVFTGTPPWTFTYTINGLDTTTVSNTTNNPYILTVFQAGTYEVIALSDSSIVGTCFTGSPTVTIDSTLPTSAITSGNATICSGQTTDIAIDFTGTAPWTFTYTIDSLNPVTISNVTDDPYILTVSQSGTYQVTALSGAGCTGTSNTGSATVSINPSFIVTDYVAICEGSNYTFGSQALSISGTYSETFVTANGCDSAVTLTLTVNPPPTSNITSGNKTICSGTTDITIDFSGTPPWNFTYTIDSLTPTTINNVTVSPYIMPVSQPGTYQVTALTGAGCTGTWLTGTTVISIDSTPPSSAITSGNDTICSGATTDITIDFTGTPPWTFTYTIDSLNPTTVSNVTDDPYILTASQSGTYQVTALSGAGCTGTSNTGSATVSINPSFIVTDYVTICEGSDYTFGSQALSISGTYNETFVTASGCDSVVTLTLTVNPLPTSNITSGNRTICSGTTDIMIDFTGVPPWTFTYTIDSVNPTTVSNVTGNPYPLTVSAAGIYKVTALSDAYCTGTIFTGTATIAIDTALPTSNITSGNAAICSGQTTGITIAFTGAPPWTFTYTIDSLNPATISNVTTNPYILTVSEAGIYEVTALSGGGCTGTNFSGSANIAVNPLPTSDITNGNAAIKICSGETAGLTIDFTGTPPWTFTYTIDGSNPVTVSNATNNPYILPVSQTGIYEVTALSDAYCTGTWLTGYLELFVNPLPTSDITSGNATLCSGDTTDIIINFTGTPPWTFTYTVDSLNPTTVSNVIVNPYILPVSSTGIYEVIALSDINCPGTSFTGSANITVNPLPTSDITSGNATICSGTTDIIINFTGTPPWTFTYTIDSLNPTTVSNVTVNPYIMPVSQAGVYEVSALADAGCQGTSLTGTAIISVDTTLPASNITSGNATLCSGETTGITIDFTGTPPWTFTYTIDSLNPTTVSNVTVNPYILMVSQAGIYEVTALSGGGCTGTSFTGSANITVNPLPTVGAGTDRAVCSGATVTLAGSGAVSYAWDNGVTDGIAFTPLLTTTYTVTGTDANGCTNADAVLVTVNPLPGPAFTYTANGFEISFLNNSLNADSYLWNFGDGDTSIFQNPVHVYQAPGDYIVTLTASNAQCGDSAVSDTVTVLLIQIESFGIENIVKIYPNPSNGQITIEINNSGQSDLSIEITNMLGQNIFSKVFKNKNAIEQIDLSGFSTGIYTVKLITNDLTKTAKLILSK